ncbi:unnamed protein product [Periconia digitata]|uniref:Phenylalanine ammonia-lyase n=1 Tax=Periconia digitata TaxID=1303443 RepID=A0A9W4UT57_9PLEO|nr:unnamed protein product [Periconia digitata]
MHATNEIPNAFRQEGTQAPSRAVTIDGNSLQLAEVIRVAEHKSPVTLTDDPNIIEAINQSVKLLNDKISQGDTVYGVNTGYGGSADVRCQPDETKKVQQALLQLLNCGVLPLDISSQYSEGAHTPSLKQEWVRAAMLIRANTVARGHSCVRMSTINALLALLNRDIIPVIPTRGSISASGDLSPLSYIAGVLEGNPEIYCWAGSGIDRRVVPANEALADADIKPIVFEPKEALGLVNGTAISAAAASTTLNHMSEIITLSQLLTAMNVEAVLGTATSFAPFISQIRPHPGQAQVASTILNALSGSKLATGLLDTHSHDLFQDRYSLRTVPQWLGPFVEDIALADSQLKIELNSTTDNPIMDPATGTVYHGGNFQAMSVTLTMEKSRAAAQAIGRMLFNQFTEMINPATNRGLPPNLCADDPSTSFTMKGVDISMAAYLSELSFLGNPVHNHVVSAEMGNQSLNSLALVSARYADSAVDLLRLMCACTLYGTCQALDLRAMNLIFEEQLQAYLKQRLDAFLTELEVHGSTTLSTKVNPKIWETVKRELSKLTTLDADDRFGKALSGTKTLLLDFLEESGISTDNLLSRTTQWVRDTTTGTTLLYSTVRSEYIKSGNASKFLGRASKLLYTFVREDLNVPMHRGIIDHPTPASWDVVGEGAADDDEQWRRKTVGHWISVIHEAIKSGRIMHVVGKCRAEGGSAEVSLLHQEKNGIA